MFSCPTRFGTDIPQTPYSPFAVTVGSKKMITVEGYRFHSVPFLPFLFPVLLSLSFHLPLALPLPSLSPLDQRKGLPLKVTAPVPCRFYRFRSQYCYRYRVNYRYRYRNGFIAVTLTIAICRYHYRREKWLPSKNTPAPTARAAAVAAIHAPLGLKREG